MMRDLVLGLEVVLADGTVLTSMNKMLKNNAGYDLKQLFVGSEGTLGVVTRAVLRVFPKRPNVKICLCALRDYDAVIALLNSARVHLGDKLTAFEAMWPDFYQLATEGRGRRAPIAAQHGAYVLLETMGRFSDDMDGELATFVESAFEEGVIEDAVIAQSLAENDDLWSVRDSVGEFQRSLGPFIAFDVSVPIGDMGNFVDACGRKLAAAFPQTKVVFFGHIADSNIHICVATGALDIHALDTVVYDCVAEFSGSISAEHGIGLLKRAFLDRSRTSAEIETMRRLKRALDPNGVLNPGKVISVA
jgi:FAD/FMN-containing dehydrogenase